MRFLRTLRLEVERKTDIIALTAFLLAVAGILFQTYHFIRGAQVVLFPPESVLVVCYSYENNAERFPHACQKESYIRMSARMAYVNTGQIGYSAVIQKESLSFSLNAQTIVHRWESFGSFSDHGEKRNRLRQDFQSDAHPVGIDGGSAVSHETFFTPHKEGCGGRKDPCVAERNFVTFGQFSSVVRSSETLTVYFKASLYGAEDKEVRCIASTSGLISELEDDGWSTVSCEVEQQKLWWHFLKSGG